MIVYTYSGGGAWPCMVYKGEGGMALCTVQVVVGVWHCVVYSGEGGMALWGGVGGGGMSLCGVQRCLVGLLVSFGELVTFITYRSPQSKQ